MRRVRRLAFGLAASAALIGFAGPAQAAPPGFTARDRDDAICMVVFGSVLGAMPDGEDKEGLSSVLTYFIGKLCITLVFILQECLYAVFHSLNLFLQM